MHSRLACSLGLLLLAGPVGAQFDKDQRHEQMRQIEAQIELLKPQRLQSPAIEQQLISLSEELAGLSASLGGDLPCAIADAGAPAPNGLPPFPPPPAEPPGCIPTTTAYVQLSELSIPSDGPAVVSASIGVSGLDPYLWDIDVQTFITHTFAGDLDITVTSPAGTVVTLTSDNGAGNDNVFDGTIWDDDANPGGQVPYTSNAGLVTDHPYVNGTLASPLVPEEALAAFVGENPNGIWTLTISDDLAGDGGELSSWGLILTAFAEPPTTFPVEEFTQTTALAIPSGPAVVNSTLDVAGLALPICKLELLTGLQHTFANDLDVTLTSPAGTVVTLTTDNGGSNDNVFDGTVWNDDANPGGPVPYTTNAGLVTDQPYTNLTLASPLVAEESLGAFLGEDPNGTWTITVSDDLGGDGGSLNSWTLSVTPCSCSSADLSATLDAAPDPVTAGAGLTYTAVLTNNGPTEAEDVSLSLPLPAGTALVSVDGGVGASCNAASPVVCSWAGATASGADRSMIVVVDVDPAATGTLNASVTAGSPTTDPDPTNNSADATTGIVVSADAAITKAATGVPDPLLIGSSFSYLLTTSNNGPSGASGIVVSDSLPANLSYVGNDCGASFSAPTLTWNVGTLTPGASVQCTLDVSVSGFGPISNTAALTAGSLDPNSTNNSDSADLAGVPFPADLSIALVSNAAGPLAPGDSVVLTVTGTNLGPGDAAGVDFLVDLGAGLDFQFSDCGAIAAGNLVDWSVPVLANGASTACALNTTIAVAGDLEVSATVSSTIDDPVLANNTTALTLFVRAVPIPALGAGGLLALLLLTLGLGLVTLRRS